MWDGDLSHPLRLFCADRVKIPGPVFDGIQDNVHTNTESVQCISIVRTDARTDARTHGHKRDLILCPMLCIALDRQ